jgi:DNA polymerase III psi subunit
MPALPPVLFVPAWHAVRQGTVARATHWPAHLTWQRMSQAASAGTAAQLALHSASQAIPQTLAHPGWQLASSPHVVSQTSEHLARQSCWQDVTQSKRDGSA